MSDTARTAAEKAGLRDEILKRLPWPTPVKQIDRAFASQAAACSGGLAEHVATAWLDIDRHLETYEQWDGGFSDEEKAAISTVRNALRRVQIPAAGTLLAAIIVEILT